MEWRKVNQTFGISSSRSAAFLISVRNRNNPQGMNPNELLRIVDSLHRDKNIQPELVFQAIESALVSAAKRQYGETAEITVSIARDDGTLTASCDGQPMDQEEIGPLERKQRNR
jgi:hypothetical protein